MKPLRRGLIREHPLIGKEAADVRTGEYLGRVVGGRTFRYRGATPRIPVTRLLDIRHDRGDGTTRAYEPREVREHVAQGRVLPSRALPPGRSAR